MPCRLTCKLVSDLTLVTIMIKAHMIIWACAAEFVHELLYMRLGKVAGIQGGAIEQMNA